MARARKDAPVDLGQPHVLSVGLIERLTCPDGQPKAFLRDRDVTGLRVRVTANGAKAFVYEAKLNGKAISKTLGKFPLLSIDEARAAARELAKTVKNDKLDPREVERARCQAEKAAAAALLSKNLTVGEVWPLYLAHGKGKKAKPWKPRYRADLQAMAAEGGVPKKRGKGVTRAGPLHPLMSWTLTSVEEDRLAAWQRAEAEAGPHQAARALMMFRGFLRWCSTRAEYRNLVQREAAAAPSVVQDLPAVKRRTDALEGDQVAPWWQGTEALQNRTAAAYLRALLLTGARREEVAALKWDQVDFRWSRLTMADKVDDTRVIPLTPYLSHMLASLPRVSEFVFASTGKSGRIADARSSHAHVLKHVGIDKLTFHGLRRSFSLLGEAAGAPAGAIAQVMGHKPSAVAEGYRPRSIDALRPYLLKIEAHILEAAGVAFDPKATKGPLRVVA